MEDAKILLTESELSSIKSIQIELQNAISELGNVEFQKNNLENIKLTVLAKLKEIQIKQNQLGSDLNKKYGDGVINLESGEFESKVA
jgi:hypothetical protein